jgi:hypothetical protein
MSIAIAIPILDGTIHTECAMSLMAAQRILLESKIETELLVISNCSCLPTARNTLVAMFLRDPAATDLLFIDADVGFDAAVIPRLLSRPEEIVAGIYPLKRDVMGWPVVIQTQDGIPIGREGLIEADFLPTGFMRIKREVFERMMQAYPELRYKDSVVETMGDGTLRQAWDFFRMGTDLERQRYTTEDYAFCQRWRDIGGRLWVDPDITFQHVGRKAYTGNFHQYLMQQPGGCNDGRRNN